MGEISDIASSVTVLKEMFAKFLSKAINMFSGNSSNVQGTVLDDLQEIGNLNNNDEYIMELKERVDF